MTTQRNMSQKLNFKKANSLCIWCGSEASAQEKMFFPEENSREIKTQVLPTGKFLHVRKVLALPESFCT